jgi:dolichol-phosphate mannosyltransferase
MNTFSIIIPIYNEEENIENLVKEIFDSLNSYNKYFEIILIDDASTDKSLLVMQSLFEIHTNKIKIVKNEKNLGQSLSIVKGIKESSHNTIMTIDADGQNNPKDMVVLLNHYFSNQEIYLVGGIRNKRKDTLVKKTSSRAANCIRRLILKDNCSDTGCSLKVFDKETFIKFPVFNGIHRFLPALFSGFGKKTLFINVDHRARIYGYSKYGTYGRLIQGIRDLIIVFMIIKKFKNNNINKSD